MIFRRPSGPGRPVGWALLLLTGVLGALLPLVALAAPAVAGPGAGGWPPFPASHGATSLLPATQGATALLPPDAAPRPLLGELAAPATAPGRPGVAAPVTSSAWPGGAAPATLVGAAETGAAAAPAALLGTALFGVLPQDQRDQATLETRRPAVQWAQGDAGAWQTIPTQQAVRVGDRVRTGAGASARLVYFEGTAVELGAETGIRVDRLEPSPDGNIITRLF